MCAIPRHDTVFLRFNILRYTLNRGVSTRIAKQGEEHRRWTYHSASRGISSLRVRATISMSLGYRHQEREVMTSPPQISLLKLSTFTSPLPFPNLFPLFLPPFPPFNLPDIASSLRLLYDINRVVFAWVSRKITIVSIHWGLHPIATGKECRSCTSKTFSNTDFLDNATCGEKLGICYRQCSCTCLQRTTTIHIGDPELSLTLIQSMNLSFCRGSDRFRSPATLLTLYRVHPLEHFPRPGHR